MIFQTIEETAVQKNKLSMHHMKKSRRFWRKNVPMPITTRDIAAFCRSFSILIETGIAVVRSLKILSERTTNPRLRNVVSEIALFVESGGTISTGMAKYPQHFNPLVINMIKVGETSGTLDHSLHRIADLLEKRIALRQKVQSAFAYPVVALLASLAVVIFLLVKVIPVFVPLFKNPERHIQMPVPTQIIISVSEFLRLYWFIYLPVVLGLIIVLFLFGRTTRGRFYFDMLRLRIPLFGTLFTKMVMARFTRTMALLLRSGIPLLESLRLVKNTTGSVNMGELLQEAHDCLEQGGTLDETLRDSPIIPPLASDIIAIGEQAGALEEVMTRIADSLEEEIDVNVRGITSIIEPVMVLVVGGIVLFIALSVFLPYFSLVRIL
jgi:type IV pilus assembly protein PilC